MPVPKRDRLPPDPSDAQESEHCGITVFIYLHEPLSLDLPSASYESFGVLKAEGEIWGFRLRHHIL